MPPWNLQNIYIYRTTEPKDGTRDGSHWLNYADDLSILYDAQGVLGPWRATTRYELVLLDEIFKENGRLRLVTFRTQNSIPENVTPT